MASLKKLPPSLLETLAGLALIILVNFAFFPGDPGFLHTPLHPCWILVLLIAVRYGMPAGLFAGAGSSAFYLVFLFQGFPSRTQLESSAEQGQLWLAVAFLMTGSILGEIRQKKIEAEKETGESLVQFSEKLRQIESAYETSERSRRILEARIVGQATTIRTVHDAVQKLQSLDMTDIYRGCLDILANHFQVTKSSFYNLEDDFFLLKASRGWDSGHVYEGKIEKTRTLMQFVLSENRMLTVRDLLSLKEASGLSDQFGDVLAMLPVRGQDGKIKSVINLEKMDFLGFNKSNLELIALVADWTSQALIRISTLQSIRSRIIEDPDEQVFTFSHLQSCVEREVLLSQVSGRSFALSLLQIKQFGFFEDATQKILKTSFVAALRRTLPKTSVIFKHRFDGIYAVLTPEASKDILAPAFEEVERIMNKFSAALKIQTVHPSADTASAQELMKKAGELIGLPA